MANGKVAKEAKCHSYESGGGDTARINLGSEDYAIVQLNKHIYVDISFRSRTCTVYDDTPGWNVRQVGTHSGKMVKCRTEPG